MKKLWIIKKITYCYFFLLKKILFLCCFFLIISCNNNQKKLNIIYVSYVYDGDTFYDQQKNSYRIFGIDTPELKSNNEIRDYYAKKAKKFLEKKILYKKIKIEILKKDYYKRSVVKIFINNININALMIEKGMGISKYLSLDRKNRFFFTNDFNFYYILHKKQQLSFMKKIGIWNHYQQIKEIYPNY